MNKIICGNTLTILKTLSDKSVNCVVTSPPYWGLRDYGIEPVIWDGDKDCKHEWNTFKRDGMSGGTKSLKVQIKGKDNFQKFEAQEQSFCLKCNAWRGSLGLEPTFELYIKHLCDIFNEIKRVLRKDGTCWVNLGDTYAGGGGWTGVPDDWESVSAGSKQERFDHNKKNTGIPAKSLMMIPQRFAIEMVNRGWILRNTIIWHKPNCMPSSAKDRFTVDFEYVYFFVKNKKYWFEQQFEENKDNFGRWGKYTNPKSKQNKYHAMSGAKEMGKEEFEEKYSRNGRNKRAVWTIPTKPFPEAHFAVYPERMIEPMIKAGCPRYVCKKCGKARVKIYEKVYKGATKSGYNDGLGQGKHLYIPNQYELPKELGYSNCGCNAEFEGGIVLDPFMGAGTTGVVAKKQGKKYLGIEIKQEYIDMANKRIKSIPETLF